MGKLVPSAHESKFEQSHGTRRRGEGKRLRGVERAPGCPAGRDSQIPEGDKAAVRENVLESMVRAPGVVRMQLGECLKAIVGTDYPERWPGLLPALLANLASQARPDPETPLINPSNGQFRGRWPGLLPALLASLASQARQHPAPWKPFPRPQTLGGLSLAAAGPAGQPCSCAGS